MGICEEQKLFFTHKPLEAQNNCTSVKSYQNLIRIRERSPESLDITGFLGFFVLFPLNRASRLWGQVEQTAVDALDLGGDTGGDMLEQVEGYILHSGGHGVHGIDRADDHAPLVRALIVTDADGLDVGDRGKILPHLALQAVLGELLPENGVRLPDSL